MTKSLLVIGGGINGVAIALESARAGYRVTVVEKSTLGSGTSSKTSKLAHGGLRYLEHYQFKVVWESLHERNRLLRNYPDVVHPLKFVIPIYRNSPWNRLTLFVGLLVYDLFSGLLSPLPWHRRLSVAHIRHNFPTLASDGLVGGFSYFDAQMDDVELLKKLAGEARELGVTFLEHTCGSSLAYREGAVVGVRISDGHTDTLLEATQVIQSTGPWSSAFLDADDPQGATAVTLSKGVHIVLPDIGYQEAFLLSAPQDKRVFFVMPYKGQTLVGTTETVYVGDPDKVSVDEADKSYLMTAFLTYFPQFSSYEILDSFVGLRPLLAHSGSALRPGVMSRDFKLVRSSTGLYSVMGGKYTTHGAVARYVVRCLNK